jgi:hypothetical protein
MPHAPRNTLALVHKNAKVFTPSSANLSDSEQKYKGWLMRFEVDSAMWTGSRRQIN